MTRKPLELPSKFQKSPPDASPNPYPKMLIELVRTSIIGGLTGKLSCFNASKSCVNQVTGLEVVGYS